MKILRRNTPEAKMDKQGYEMLRKSQEQLQFATTFTSQQIDNLLEEIMKLQPRCSRCGKHRFREDMKEATQDEADDYYSDGEGYGPPEVGWLVCGDKYWCG